MIAPPFHIGCKNNIVDILVPETLTQQGFERKITVLFMRVIDSLLYFSAEQNDVMNIFCLKNWLLAAVLCLVISAVPSCKSGKMDCPAYSDNPAPTGIPKGNKTNSGVFPPNMKR